MSERLKGLNIGIVDDLVTFLGVENNESNFTGAYLALQKLDAGSTSDMTALEGLMKAFGNRKKGDVISLSIAAPYVKRYMEVVAQYPEVQPIENLERFGVMPEQDIPEGTLPLTPRDGISNKKTATSAIGNLKTARGETEVITQGEQLKIDITAAEAAYASGDVWAGKFLQTVRQYGLQKQAKKIDTKANPGR